MTSKSQIKRIAVQSGLHPETERAIAAGTHHFETHAEFARRVALIEQEACAKAAAEKFARIHTYASENSGRYIAMREAGEAIAAAIRRGKP